MPLSQAQVSQAVYDLISADDPLLALVTGGVFDLNNVPKKPTVPYLVVGEPSQSARDTFGGTGQDIELLIHTWSRDRGKAEGEAIQSALYDALNEATLTLSGYRCIACLFQNNHSMQDNSSGEKLVHAVDRYLIQTEAI